MIYAQLRFRVKLKTLSSEGQGHWDLWTVLLWTSEAVQSDQALTSFKILLPPFSQKWHGCEVGAWTCWIISRTAPSMLSIFYVTVSSIHCLHLCVHVSLSICLSCPPLSHSLPSSVSLSLSLPFPSEFSEVVDLFTSCSVPLPPFPPELEMAGVTWLCLKWQRPTSSPKEDDIFYILEMEEEGSVCCSQTLFKLRNSFFLKVSWHL